jgi:hypothetical protein
MSPRELVDNVGADAERADSASKHVHYRQQSR